MSEKKETMGAQLLFDLAKVFFRESLRARDTRHTRTAEEILQRALAAQRATKGRRKEPR